MAVLLRRMTARLEQLRIEQPCRSSIEEFESDGVMAVMTDMDARVTATNTAFDENTRTTEVSGKNCNCLQRRDDPRNQASNAAIREAIRQTVDITVPLVNINRDGHEYLVLVSIRPILGKSGNLMGFYSVQAPLLHVTPVHELLGIVEISPPIERNSFEAMELDMIEQIDALFPDLIGEKRIANVNRLECKFLAKRLQPTKRKQQWKAFEGFDEYVENGISSGSDSEDEDVDQLPLVASKSSEEVRQPTVCETTLTKQWATLTAHEQEQNRDVFVAEVRDVFFDAVHSADYARIQDTLAEYVPLGLLDVNAFNAHGLTACHIAAHKGDLTMLRLLVDDWGASLLTHRWNYTVWAHALNSLSKGVGCTQRVLDWLMRHGAEDLNAMGNRSLVAKYTRAYRKQVLSVGQFKQARAKKKQARSKKKLTKLF